MFTFHRVNYKWEIKINGKWAFEMYQKQGIPEEFLEDWVNRLPKQQKMLIALKDWKNHI